MAKKKKIYSKVKEDFTIDNFVWDKCDRYQRSIYFEQGCYTDVSHLFLNTIYQWVAINSFSKFSGS